MKDQVRILASALMAVMVFSGCQKPDSPKADEDDTPKAFVEYAKLDDTVIRNGGSAVGVSLDAKFSLVFSENIDLDKMEKMSVFLSGYDGKLSFAMGDGPRELVLVLSDKLLPSRRHILTVSKGKTLGLNIVDSFKYTLTTEYDPSDKFPRISEDELFEKVQRAAFGYFWDHAHPVSGLSRERKGSGETVTSGGSGFGLMTVPVAIERGWISRQEGVERILKIVTFLDEKSQRFHGAWSHWLNGTSGNAVPFSTYDNGADLVETAFMVQGLLTLKHYFTGSDASETAIRNKILNLWEAVEWDWFRQNGQNRLYWHWSENYGWKMNMAISGWNEAMIVYILAASSPTHTIDKVVYDEGWTRNGANKLNYRSPLFFTHYSFLGLDPRKLKDEHFDYWAENTKMAQTNHDYCASKSANGYSDRCWGLTASDYSKGYTASSPNNDTGTVAPTAALASFPYVPEYSKKAMEYFYYVLGDRLWGEYGFKDAFSLKDNWFASSYIAIDEGPIVVMMENYRTGLLWNCFMQDEDVQAGLTKLGFTWK